VGPGKTLQGNSREPGKIFSGKLVVRSQDDRAQAFPKTKDLKPVTRLAQSCS